MATTQFGSSQVKLVGDVKNETHQLLRKFNQKGRERAVFVKQNASAVKLFLNENEKNRLAVDDKDTMAAIKSRLQHIRQEGKEIIKNAHDIMQRIAGENKELAAGVKRFLTHSETERLAVFKTMMDGLHQSIRELQQRTEEIRSESGKLLKQLGGGTLKTEIKKFLRDSEETRMRDFKKMMNEIKTVVGEIQAYEKGISGDIVKKKEITHEVKSEKKAVGEGRLNVEAERKELMFTCKKCETRHWPFQKCPGEKSSFKKKKIT